MSTAAIGIFDSGLGGLTVLKAVARRLPQENIVYLGDTARVPYGTKSKEAIIRFSLQNMTVLLQRKVKMVVVACNSSSSHALSVLMASCPVPVIGVIEPGVARALAETRNQRIGVIATQATVASEAYAKALRRSSRNVRVVSQPCPLFVPLVEEGWTQKAVTYQIAETYLATLRQSRVDALILGCTHYPLLKPVLRKIMGPEVRLVDSAQEVSRAVQQRLQADGLLSRGRRRPQHRFLVTDQPGHFGKLARRFLGHPMTRIQRIEM